MELRRENAVLDSLGSNAQHCECLVEACGLDVVILSARDINIEGGDWSCRFSLEEVGNWDSQM